MFKFKKLKNIIYYISANNMKIAEWHKLEDGVDIKDTKKLLFSLREGKYIYIYEDGILILGVTIGLIFTYKFWRITNKNMKKHIKNEINKVIKNYKVEIAKNDIREKQQLINDIEYIQKKYSN